jgi:glutamate--cysteine ligase
MSAPPISSGEKITDRRQLIAHFEAGSKPRQNWRIGTEHEKFVFRRSDLRRAPYEGPDGIKALLEGLTRFGWTPVLENGNPIALTQGACNITLEPGGQFELSGAPVETIHQTCAEVQGHLKQMREVTEELGLGMLGVGFDPKWLRDDVPWMPKGRYRIMREYMPKKGKLGLDMMLRTCTVQVNLDFASEADMVRKFRASLALQPVATALFAASPFTEGRPNGYQSYRSHVWTDLDPDRSGMLPFVFEDGFGFERYVDYILDVPMYFVYRDSQYVDASGQSFRDFLKGKLPALPGEIPGTGDWNDHITTAFPEVRLKRYLEMRGADGGPWQRLCALPALWVGLLYDDTALDAASELIKGWTVEEMRRLRAEVPKSGLKAQFRGRTVRELAVEVVRIAQAGLRRRARADDCGEDESHFVETLTEIAETGRSPSDRMLEDFATKWEGRIDPIFRDYAY